MKMENELMDFTPAQVEKQVQSIQHLKEHVLINKEHYGVIPGCGDKPALLKAGAEKLAFMFRLAPEFLVVKTELPNNHREYEVSCKFTHQPTGNYVGAGLGVCSTMEAKYRYRKAQRSCPECGVQAIIKGKAEFGGGWLCYKAKGGCGFKFKDGDKVIEDQPVGRLENEDLADSYNTVIKMAKKRAYVDAVITCTAASDFFTQDIDENASFGQTEENPDPRPKASTPAPESDSETKERIDHEKKMRGLRADLNKLLQPCKTEAEFKSSRGEFRTKNKLEKEFFASRTYHNEAETFQDVVNEHWARISTNLELDSRLKEVEKEWVIGINTCTDKSTFEGLEKTFGEYPILRDNATHLDELREKSKDLGFTYAD